MGRLASGELLNSGPGDDQTPLGSRTPTGRSREHADPNWAEQTSLLVATKFLCVLLDILACVYSVLKFVGFFFFISELGLVCVLNFCASEFLHMSASAVCFFECLNVLESACQRTNQWDFFGNVGI